MKKLIGLFLALAIAGVGLFSCGDKNPTPPEEEKKVQEPQVGGELGEGEDEDEDDMTDVQPSEASAEVIAFFQANLPELYSGTRSFEFFSKIDPTGRNFDNNEGWYKDICLMINSTEELKEIAVFEGEAPPIDYDKYTLIVGQIYTTSGHYIVRQSIDVTDDPVVMNLVSHKPLAYLLAGEVRSFWGLYPKCTRKEIVLNRLFEEETCEN